MSENVNDSVHTEGLLGDYFSVESHLLSTRSADIFKAVDKSRTTPVCLWTLRHPLAKNSNAVQRFLDRMNAIQHVQPPVCDPFSFGVDAAGVAFGVLPTLDGYPIDLELRESFEAERRFISALRLIDRLHQHGIVCGDICAASFWTERSGDVKFIGIMGSFDSEAVQTSQLPPIETLHYVAPEQRSGAGVEQASDVYALAVLGYHLLTRAYPFPDPMTPQADEHSRDMMKPVSAYLKNAPQWADEVFFRCLASDPQTRPISAGAVLKLIGEIRERGAASAAAPMRIKSQAVGQPRKSMAIPVAEPAREVQTPPPAASGSSKKLLIGGGVVGVAILAILLQIFQSPGVSTSSNPTVGTPKVKGPSTSGDVQDALENISDAPTSIGQLEKQLESLVSSDDPIAHDTIVRLAVNAKNPQIRQRAERGLIDRARRLGLLRSSEEVRQWLRTMGPGDLPPAYEPILRSMDSTVPMEARNKYLRQAYPSAQAVVLRLAAALGFDSNNVEGYQPVLSQLIGDSGNLPDANERSALALILANPEISAVFADDVIQRMTEIPDADIVWLMRILAERKDSNVRAIANVAIERKLLPPVRRVFLEMLRDRGNLVPALVLAFVRAAAGALQIEDISRFGEWYDLDSEKVLLAVMADNTDTALLVEAFETVAGKSLSLQPSTKLINWVRNHFWEERGELAHVIGVIANVEYYSDKEVSEALAPLDKHSKDQQLMNILFGSNKPGLVRAVIDRYTATLGPGRLLSLLSHPDKAVRLLAIGRLKDLNQLELLKIIIDNYEREKDPEVRQAYKDSFWVIKQRK